MPPGRHVINDNLATDRFRIPIQRHHCSKNGVIVERLWSAELEVIRQRDPQDLPTVFTRFFNVRCLHFKYSLRPIHFDDFDVRNLFSKNVGHGCEVFTLRREISVRSAEVLRRPAGIG